MAQTTTLNQLQTENQEKMLGTVIKQIPFSSYPKFFKKLMKLKKKKKKRRK